MGPSPALVEVYPPEPGPVTQSETLARYEPDTTFPVLGPALSDHNPSHRAAKSTSSDDDADDVASKLVIDRSPALSSGNPSHCRCCDCVLRLHLVTMPTNAELARELDALRSEVAAMRDSVQAINELFESVKTRNEALSKENKALRDENKSLKDDGRLFSQRLADVEQYSRTNNVEIKGDMVACSTGPEVAWDKDRKRDVSSCMGHMVACSAGPEVAWDKDRKRDVSSRMAGGRLARSVFTGGHVHPWLERLVDEQRKYPRSALKGGYEPPVNALRGKYAHQALQPRVELPPLAEVPLRASFSPNQIDNGVTVQWVSEGTFGAAGTRAMSLHVVFVPAALTGHWVGCSIRGGRSNPFLRKWKQLMYTSSSNATAHVNFLGPPNGRTSGCFHGRCAETPSCVRAISERVGGTPGVSVCLAFDLRDRNLTQWSVLGSRVYHALNSRRWCLMSFAHTMYPAQGVTAVRRTIHPTTACTATVKRISGRV
ncbi:hypothetical protein HPB50_005785 [Hyalomma asiaticum]|uniref:Uncharacterized protein n=1 Tax=Hyalomma asiaticum TaxID=266040 RepID=A0ACB7T422_HYAAI|nr:hypothetical protein HPB50_005785 [Hyalomma asiaticum]